MTSTEPTFTQNLLSRFGFRRPSESGDPCTSATAVAAEAAMYSTSLPASGVDWQAARPFAPILIDKAPSSEQFSPSSTPTFAGGFFGTSPTTQSDSMTFSASQPMPIGGTPTQLVRPRRASVTTEECLYLIRSDF